MIELRQGARAGRAVGVDAIGRAREALFFESVDKGTSRQFFNFNGRIGQSLVAEIGRQVGGPNGIGAPPLRHGNVQDIAAGLQIARAIGFKRLIPLLAIGGLALGLMASRPSPDDASED